MIYVDLLGIDIQLSEVCEEEFQRQMDKYDGELCMLSSGTFCDVNLIKPDLKAQVILNFFANCSCPISMLRFAASMHPYNYPRWPLVSYELSQAYMMTGLEVIMNMRLDKRALSVIEPFQLTHEFASIINIANEIINTIAVPTNICPEIYTYVQKHMKQLNLLTKGEEQ